MKYHNNLKYWVPSLGFGRVEYGGGYCDPCGAPPGGT